MTLLHNLNPRITGGEEIETIVEMTNLDGFKVEILQIYHRNPQISQYTKRIDLNW